LKFTKQLWFQKVRCLVLAALLFAPMVLLATSSTFQFTLDEPCKTSAGVFAPDGTLIRTLWSKVRYSAGTYTAIWDGLDDSTNAVAAGLYQIRVLQHNTEYVWDGAIGNTSDALSGPTVHTGYWPIQDMTMNGTNGFYVSGYNEGNYDFRSFSTTNPQRVNSKWGPEAAATNLYGNTANIYDLTWSWTVTDGHWVYFGAAATYSPTGGPLTPGCIVAFNVADNTSANFGGGTMIKNGSNPIFPGIYVGTQPSLSGLAVQLSGNLLAAAVATDNRVYLLDKLSGATLNSISVTSPGRMCFSSDGSLWVVSGNAVMCFTNLTVNPTLALNLGNFNQPMAVAVNPTNSNFVLVADGGSSQQVKAFDNAGNSLWTYGLGGGYATNGVAVQTNKFWFFNGEIDDTFLSFESDGTFWVGDGGNHRALHFSATCNYLDQIMYQPHSYNASVDQNNPSRVFNQFLEFNVDYTKPLAQAWTLVNNWKANVAPVYYTTDQGGYDQGIYDVTTFTNGRTYALINNYTYKTSNNFVFTELCELATNQLRFTGINPAFSNETCWISLGPDGSARRSSPGSATWYGASLNGFDANNNPIWNPETLIASAPEGSTDPFPQGKEQGNIRTTISTNNILITFNQDLNEGYHLGGIRVGGNNWLWKASPSINYMDGLGTYEISNGVQYGGNTLQAIDRNVFYGYHGEFFRHAGQAGQSMHFYDDGLFVGQFGEANVGHDALEGALPGFAGNGYSPTWVKTANCDYYLWVNDESGHGPQRWHIVNARNIQELCGSGPLGTTIMLTNPPVTFPTALTAKNGNQSVELSWLPVAAATTYNIRYSLMNGGPYNCFAVTTSNLDYVVGGLTNGQAYYFAVSAIISGVEGIPSEQVVARPFDSTQSALCAGQMAEGGLATPVIDLNSNAPAAGQPSWTGAEHLTGLLNPRELDDYGYGDLQNESLGTQGYIIIDDEGPATSLSNLIPAFPLAYGSGWIDVGGLERQYNVNGNLTTNNGLLAASAGTITISITDTNYHFLTVVSPAEPDTSQESSQTVTLARKFSLGITSTNGSTAQYSVNEPFGLSHVFQFLFQGGITLWANGVDGSNAVIQSIFLDDAPVSYRPVTTDITNGLVLHYPLNADGVDTWSENNLTLVGPPFFGNGAVYWNGNMPTLGYSSPQIWPQAGLTVTAWINMMTPLTNSSVAACYGNYPSSANHAYFQFYASSNTLTAKVIQDAEVNYIGRMTTASLSGGWHFVAFTWSGGSSNSSIQIYLDGNRIDNADNGAGIFSAAYSGGDLPFALGEQLSTGAGNGLPFLGGENGVRMYNRPLAVGEIDTLYANGLEGATPTYPRINDISLVGANLNLSVGSGLAGMTYSVLMSTNLTQPLNQWTEMASNIAGSNGNFIVTVTNAVSPVSPQRFYILRTP